jgi:hypothetical protein
MRSNADRAGRGVTRIGMIVRNACDGQPDGQQQAQPAHGLRDGPHGVPHES